MILTGKIPFSGSSYREIVYKNMRSKIDFDLLKDMNISKQTIDLIKKMLEKDPNKRISSKQALNHKSLNNMLSKSPLIMKPFFNANNLLNH